MNTKEKAKNVEQAALFIFYRCGGEYCNTMYAIEEEKTEEPICPCCGSYYFSHITDRKIEI